MSRRRQDPLKKILEKQRGTIRDRLREATPDGGPGPLVVIDQAPVLREWRKRCQDIELELKEIAAELESFHADAAPAFSLWLSSSFGELLTGVREMGDALMDAETIAAAVQSEAKASRVSDRQAYQTVMKRKKNGEELFPRSFFTEDDGWDEGWSDVDPFTDYRQEDSPEHSHSSSNTRDTHSEKRDEASGFGAFGRFVEAAKERRAKTPEELKLRALYRRLAFLLHPDANPALNERERQIWHLVQAAYEAKDADKLELLLLRVESGSTEWLEKVTHVGSLQVVFETKRKELHIAKSEVARLHRDEAWRFWSTRHSEEKRSLLASQTEDRLVKEFLRLQTRLRTLNARFERLSGNAPGRFDR